MFHIFYTITFLGFLLFSILALLKKKIFLIIASVVFAILFIASVFVSDHIVDQAVQLFLEDQKTMMALSDSDPNKMNEEFRRQTSSYQQENASEEIERLAIYPWDKNKIDIIEGPNGAIAFDAMQNVVFPHIADSHHYEAFNTEEGFQKIVDNSDQYIGKYVEVIGSFQERAKCSQPDLLEIFPPIQNSVLMQEKMVLGENTYLLYLYYWPVTAVDAYIEYAITLPGYAKYVISGGYIGVYTQDDMVYHVLIAN